MKKMFTRIIYSHVSTRYLVTIAISLVCAIAQADTDLQAQAAATVTRPNFLFVITDDQSWEHTSRAGSKAVATPNFDQIANNGIYFENAFANAPSCTASRSAIITGRPMWQLRDAAQLWGGFDSTKITSYQLILRDNGYRIGFTGKGWAPGKIFDKNPLGKSYNSHIVERDKAFSKENFSANFEQFLQKTNSKKPFSFWLSPSEPHRPFVNGIGKNSGMIELKNIRIPAFLPDHPKVREDMADYLYEINWFDHELGSVIQLLKDKGLYENTVIIFTSDNGMPFPRAKSTLYHHGTRVPLAIQWPIGMKPQPANLAFINLVDIAPTLLELAGVPIPQAMTGRSFASLLLNKVDTVDRSFTVSAQGKTFPYGTRRWQWLSGASAVQQEFCLYSKLST